MAATQKKDSKDTTPPEPETLQVADSSPKPTTPSTAVKPSRVLRRGTYRPSHKATFIGLSVVIAILALNAGVIAFIMRSQAKSPQTADQNAVTISPGVLNTLGVSRNPVGSSGTELVVGPNSRFNGTVTIGSNVSIGGQLSLNSKFIASDASLAQLQAGKTSLDQLNVNGDGTVSSFTLRKDLTVSGVTSLQGPVTMAQLLTVNNSLNVAGNLAVGGTLTARGFEASSLVSDTTLMVGGHIITRGNAPGVSPGGALGSNGTVSISGNDASGTVAANIGVGASSGMVAYVSFRQTYSNTPHVVVTPVGRVAGTVYINRSASGFSINVSSPMDPGGYAFDYIVMQ